MAKKKNTSLTSSIVMLCVYLVAFVFLLAISFYAVVIYLIYLFIRYGIPKILKFIKDHTKKNDNDIIQTEEPSYFENYFINNEHNIPISTIDIKENEELSDCFESNNFPMNYDVNNEDEEYEIYREFVIQAQKASTSLLQRKFKIGYNKAAHIIDKLEEEGVIGPQLGSNPREVYIRQNHEENTIDFSKYTFDYSINDEDKYNHQSTFEVVSANPNLSHFYYLIELYAPISKEELKEKCDLTEYQFEYSINILLENNAIYYHINKLCINDNFHFTFQYEQSEEYEILNKIYNTDKYKQYLNIKTGIEFEYYLAKLLKEKGYKTDMTPKSNDYGADIIAIKDNIKYVIQCKFYSSPIGIQAVQEVLGAIKYYDGNIAIVATNNSFTNQAIELAKRSNVILWDGIYIEKNFIK